MKTFKLILFFVFLSNGYSLNTTEVQDCDSQSPSNQESINDFSHFLNDLGIVVTYQKSSKTINPDNLDKKLGFGSFNSFDGQYSALLVKNATGAIKNADSLAKLDKELLKWLNLTKASSPEDDIA